MNIKVKLNESKTIATITLNRINKSNALDKSFIEEFSSVLKDLANTLPLKICLIESAAKHFCVGADIQWLQQSLALNDKQNLEDVKLLAHLLHQLYHLPCITIAKSHGSVFGGGIGLLACCDFVIADESSQFCFSEINLGIAPATIAPYVSNKISLQTMRRLIMSANVFSAQEARDHGLVDAVYSREEINIVLQHWLDLFSSKPKSAILENKRMLDELSNVTQEIVDLSIQRLAVMRQSETAQACLKGFLQQLADKKAKRSADD